MPMVSKGPYYIDSYKLDSTDFGDSPIADVVIGHPDGFKIVVHIECPFLRKDITSIHVEWP